MSPQTAGKIHARRSVDPAPILRERSLRDSHPLA